MKFHRRLCPECKGRGLQVINFVKATVLIDGKRAPDSWTYFACKECAARFKSRGGKWEPVTDVEWNRIADGK